MPRPNAFINDTELAICGRVRRVRYFNFLSQPKFAKALGETLDRVASVEYGRTPLTVELADKIAGKFDVSLAWLAQGRGRMHPCGGLILRDCPDIKGDLMLSAVFSDELRSRLDSSSKARMVMAEAIIAGEVSLPSGDEGRKVTEQLQFDIEWLFQELSHAEREKLFVQLVRTLAKFTADVELGRDVEGDASDGIQPQKDLHQISELVKSESVKALVPVLMKRVQALTSTPGSKAELAAHLGVPAASLSQWLGGTREPGGENTLRLLRWVERQKRKAS